MNIYAIKDEIIGFNGTILVAEQDEIVERQFKTVVNEEGSQYNLWYKDFSLWHIGEMDKITGHLKEIEPRLISRGSSVLKQEKNHEI